VAVKKLPPTMSVSGKYREETPGWASCEGYACRRRILSLARMRAASHRAKPENRGSTALESIGVHDASPQPCCFFLKASAKRQRHCLHLLRMTA
jgi:hypothetical protein